MAASDLAVARVGEIAEERRRDVMVMGEADYRREYLNQRQPRSDVDACHQGGVPTLAGGDKRGEAADDPAERFVVGGRVPRCEKRDSVPRWSAAGSGRRSARQ